MTRRRSFTLSSGDDRPVTLTCVSQKFRSAAMNPPIRLLSGQCSCGSTRYSVRDEFRYALNCHCSQCRRATGSAFKAFAAIEREKLSVLRGADEMLIFGDEITHDARCATCGSLQYSIVREGRFAHVTLGTLTDEPSTRPSAHIFVASKAPWFTITDSLTQHAEFVT